MSEKALFKVGGVYRQRDGFVVRLSESFGGNHAKAEHAYAISVKCHSQWGWRNLHNGKYWFRAADADCGSHLIPGELHEVNGEWVPLEQSLKFPSGATLQTDGSKIIGRVEAETRSARFAKLDHDVISNDEGLYSRLVKMRGGCSCHIAPPCGSCCNPLTEDEADSLGLLDDDGLAGEPIRPALTWGAATPFDTFGPDWRVYSDPVTSGFAPTPVACTDRPAIKGSTTHPAIAGLLRG